MVTNDLTRWAAKKCYEKALALDAVNDEAGIALTTMYEREGKQPKALAVYRDVTKKNSRAKWAWVRLADYHAQKEQFQDAQGDQTISALSNSLPLSLPSIVSPSLSLSVVKSLPSVYC